ncbi:hypothetical protein ANTQUA_LOCUS9034 [Anthophora quadrimaculata]
MLIVPRNESFVHESFASTSAKKLSDAEEFDVAISSNFTYCILEFVTVFSTISSAVLCRKCKGEVNFKLSNFRGASFKIFMTCKCDSPLVINSCPTIKNAAEINCRLIFVMRLLGIGHEGLNIFCGLMDMCQGISKSAYYACLENIHIAASAVYKIVLSQAVAQEKAGKPEDELTVSGDGTWKKRGFSSLFGASTLIGKYSNKVLDACVMSSLCGTCNLWKTKKVSDPISYEKWYGSHQEKCTINHTGSSGKMEIDAIVTMFSQSLPKYGVKYVTYIGDGDSKTFNGILKAEPYGTKCPVTKKECVGHVEKRMGSRLRIAKKANKGIGGKGSGKLTDKVIGQLTRYYGLAIPGENSWCKWRKAEAEGTDFHHDQAPLSEEVQNVIKPIYEDLSREDLLTRCLGAETQNNNESLHSLIWTFAPKHLHAGPKIVEIACFLAVIIFNEGFQPILKTMNTLGLQIGFNAQAYAHHRDNTRIDRSERCSSNLAKQARIDSRKEQATLEDFHEVEEGGLYAPGIAD